MRTLPETLVPLFAKHGITCVNRRGNGPTWDGKTLDIASADNDAWLMHELAHLLTGSRIDLPNYGLGGDPGGGDESDQTLSDEQCTIEENRALLTGVILLKSIGSDGFSIRAHSLLYGIVHIEDTEAIYDRLPPHVQELCSFQEMESLIRPKVSGL